MLKLKYPEEIRVGIHTYRVMKPFAFREKTGIFGQCDNCLHEIRVSEMDQGGAPRPETAVCVTFFHEVLHAIDCIYSNGSIEALDNSELIVSQLAEGLAQVFLEGNFPVLEDNHAKVHDEETSRPSPFCGVPSYLKAEDETQGRTP